MSATDSAVLRVERTFAAPPEAVFDAWTNPEVLRRWWAPQPSWRTPVAEVDLRVGGAYRLSMEDPEGVTYTVCGEYLEVRRPQRLIYTWCWEDEQGRPGRSSTVAVDFVANGGSTTVVLEHSGLDSASARAAHRSGWDSCLESLRRAVFDGGAQGT